MREIFFRGKKVINDEWVEGLLVEDTEFYGEPDFHTYIVNHKHPSGCFGGDIYFEVDPETVGQYTGLTDKNGTKIFEGDVVKRCFTLTRGPNKESREVQVGVVWYDNVTCGYLIRGACNLRRQWPGDTIEVIGNIHDNPELMEGKRHG